MEFHERLRLIREKKKLQQKDAAAKVGIKNNTLSSYESGDRQPDFNMLIKLADLYDVSVEYLLRGKENTQNEPNNLFFFDTEGLSVEEIEDIKRHIEYVKWKSSQENQK
ncbi:helix-turn-helix domain-containing protein [Mesobacillus stamsii]|uniref:Transcriptional regulator with XRE-family HTH domain n=1 Tax=Mesobacillus stamsii TaxID=225347 RepID=A0ABU0FSL0_9BACI|nr:helix-turn-helix transcriptional regulator [Mesobacillus stamsii]MDQ0412910.1 transcriptional regulator with XRE-family HTH domain [Mesobacillus stamsii]